jgi:hypothetical protein
MYYNKALLLLKTHPTKVISCPEVGVIIGC